MLFKILSRLLSRSRAQKAFNNVYRVANNSQQFYKYCNQVHKLPILQFNTLSPQQLNYLIDQLNLSNTVNLLDIGCGNGEILNYIAEKYQVNATGIDFIDIDIVKNRDSISYHQVDIQQKGSLSNLAKIEPKSFSRIMAIDSMYGLISPYETLKEITKLLCSKDKESCVFVFSYSLFRIQNNALENTPLGQALNKICKENPQLSYKTKDFTDNDFEFWQSAHQALEEMGGEFEFGEDYALWHIKRREVDQHLKAHKDQRIRKLIITVHKE